MFNRWTLGDAVLKKLNVSDEQLANPQFDLLAHLGFGKREVEAANLHVCGAMTLEGAPHLEQIQGHSVLGGEHLRCEDRHA